LHWRSRSRHLSYGAWQKLRIAAIERPDVREVDPGSMMLSNRLALAVTRSAASIRLHGRMADVPLEARARRPRPLVDLGWALPVVSIFVTATFKGGTNSLPPEIQVGRVVAGVGDAAIEMLLPFGRSGRQLIGSGGAAVVGVDAIGGPPHGDFTNESGAQRAALRHPMGLSGVVVGVMSNVVGEVGDQLGPPGQVLPPVGVIVDRLGNSG
jgi:hypothetical protein